MSRTNEALQDEMEGVLFHRVLLVEDDPSHSLLIHRALEPITNSIHLSRSVSDATQKMAEEQYDLVITDLSLPDSDGVSHVRTFQDSQPDTAVVVLTVTTRIEDVVSAMRFGAKDFILKSFETDFRELLRLSLTRVYSSIQVERERKKLLVAVENSDEALALLDTQGRIRYSNNAFSLVAQRCHGDSDNLLSLFSDQIVNYEELREQVKQKLPDLAAGGLWNTEVQVTGDEPGAYTLTLSGLDLQLPQIDEEGREIVVWFRDISELKRREKFQRELISTTTHDLKGPMGAILTGTELLEEQLEEGSRASEILLRVRSSALGVVNLIDEFLSARRLEEGSLILKPSEQPLKLLFDDIQDNFQTIADSRKITLTFDIQDDVSVMVDKMGFFRVMGNLLSNALKFTQKYGSVDVVATVGEDGKLKVRVSDTGSGIEAGELKRIFNRYARLDRHQEVSGSGIGLFVVRSIVEAHGGNLQVESTVGKGTSFVVEFPESPPVDERGELISLDFAE